ncbi:MAG: TetR/AcrR family transcriptional regulator [Anaerolineae bacterium]|nr:TetR/AcrR family transcriptional regulator [Anaerolineae bacterium]
MRTKRELPMDVMVLDAAQQLVQQRGYNAFSYHDLADEIGIKTASIHYYFPTKGDLGKALMQRYTLHIQESLTEIDAHTTEPKRKLRSFFDLFAAGMCVDGGKLCLGCMLASDLMTLPNGLQEDVRAFFECMETWLVKVLKEGRSAGTFHYVGSPEKTAQVLVATLNGAMITARAFGDDKHLNESTAWLLSMIGSNPAQR